MDRPSTHIDIKRAEGQVRVIFTPGLTIDQWGQTLALNSPMTRAEFEAATQELADEWGVTVAFDPPN